MVELQSFKEGKVQLITLRSADREHVSYLDLSWKLQDSLEKLNDEESTVVVLFDMSGINLQPRMKYADSEICSISDLLADIKFPTIGIVESGANLTVLELFLCCDIRIASKQSTFSMSHVLEGYSPIDGGTQRLPRIAGIGRAMDFLLTGRIFEAEEAIEFVVWHLVFGKIFGNLR